MAASDYWSWFQFAAFLIGYTSLCQYLRFQRRDAMHRKFNYKTKESLSRMTNVEAQAITQYLSELEFPKIYYTAVQFALFLTYGIPTISSLLVATKEFSTQENASKRYADTGILIQEFAAQHPRSERTLKAIARMNYIHSGYQKAGKISNEDMLYTLSVFITEPVAWIKKYEWRELTDMEICAIAAFWKSIGDAMEIVYDGYLSKKQWRDGLEFYTDIKAWAEDYEKTFMVPAQTNKKTADELVPLLLHYVPHSFRPFASSMVCVLMGERLRNSMMYPTPSAMHFAILNGVFTIRRLILRYLSLPRPDFMAVREIQDKPDPQTGKFHPTRYLSHPWYVKPNIINTWGPEGWFVWAFGGDLPGSKNGFYDPDGYSLDEIGPKGMKNKGKKEMDAWQKKLERERPAGCPFAFAR